MVKNIKRKIICISDTHGKHEHLTEDIKSLIEGTPIDKDNTIIIHAGDVSNVGRPNEIKDFLDWFSNFDVKHKVFIAGNHDWGFETNNQIAPEYEAMGVTYLMDRMVEINGLKIYGSPWQPRFHDWAFNVNRGDAIAKKWELIPNDLDILITHGPVFGILDNTIPGIRAGCEELYKRVMEVKPKYHICGHIHYGYGIKIMDDTVFINASSLDERYTYQNEPIVFYL